MRLLWRWAPVLHNARGDGDGGRGALTQGPPNRAPGSRRDEAGLPGPPRVTLRAPLPQPPEQGRSQLFDLNRASRRAACHARVNLLRLA
ncbi:hypothetical protein AAFF_G00423280 [Aldrovandia affinis]|uniref:Uncharacterized protein n=1 Tax=Aldrovandia affinis TaxID=143900 RepID=A0AAD7X056_9TELE|nr:hypothetical protein AAFF_G00423280 [Aldrovandia affinis]